MSFIRLIIGSLAGAGLMYYLDPEAGRRRRALLRDQFVHMKQASADRASGTAEHAVNRARGKVTETVHRFTSDEVSDDVLVARARSIMGHSVSHPHSIEVTANEGTVTVNGHISARDVQPFIAKLRSVPGVRHVNNQLQVHEETDTVAQEQGGERNADEA